MLKNGSLRSASEAADTSQAHIASAGESAYPTDDDFIRHGATGLLTLDEPKDPGGAAIGDDLTADDAEESIKDPTSNDPEGSTKNTSNGHTDVSHEVEFPFA